MIIKGLDENSGKEYSLDLSESRLTQIDPPEESSIANAPFFTVLRDFIPVRTLEGVTVYGYFYEAVTGHFARLRTNEIDINNPDVSSGWTYVEMKELPDGTGGKVGCTIFDSGTFAHIKKAVQTIQEAAKKEEIVIQ